METAEIRGSKVAMPNLRGVSLWAISAHLVKPRKGRPNYTSRPSEVMIANLWEMATNEAGLLIAPTLMKSSNWHDGEMIKRLRMLQTLILCQDRGGQALYELAEARVPLDLIKEDVRQGVRLQCWEPRSKERPLTTGSLQIP